ncbi:STM4012 family radical SAM protein [Plantactinospora sp. KLBMP9567]|uniref:STM4012 family radical SAM protein n=1 Tax=Plantactinospora sp. KLBMP9567 TaxID=3085900 RepID=UPI002981EF51|nr:STM4012 family radical SAM protein [Plantactinospora sp. KLBMP9567]MDW5323236.1 STM4012 family radical SAM protein [Plantactinospora sp. KLBMP9567]MDW5330701.1 STM4012 family radical SAM protein [Plantactinospora sp. KLBMP9567]
MNPSRPAPRGGRAPTSTCGQDGPQGEVEKGSVGVANSLDGSPYQGYLYAYPHKTAYRPLRPRPALREVWAGERRDALFLYLHVPFCEMRCGFCNLFTRSNPPAEQVRGYLDQLARQADRVREALGDGVGYARVAVGGGTPTYLDAAELTAMFDLLAGFGARLGSVPMAVETSPATATADRIAVLAERGTTRVSIGVQSFLDSEARAAGRPQRRAEVERALDTIRAYDIPELNLDLIYGIPGQTSATWAESISSALRWRPEEVFLYPLYVRPLTGLGRIPATADGADPAWDAQRLALYRQGRDALRAAGYRQLSLRHFRHADLTADDPGRASDDPVRTFGGSEWTSEGPRLTADDPGRAGPDYCCQDDGMVGLGCGARSYTTDLHYSFDYAVGVRHVRGIIEDYLRRPAVDFDVAEVGFRLDPVEQRRRWLVKSLLRAEGFDPAGYLDRFGSRVDDDFPQLDRLAERGWLTSVHGRTALTEAGLERSDAIGPWLVSGPVRRAMAEYPLR